MPVRPENRARYPKDWKTVVVPRVRARSGDVCECTGQCGLRHVVVEGKQLDLPPDLWIPSGPAMRCTAANGQPHPVTGSKVILTVMHLNHRPEDCDDDNLLHGCQRCHNRYDAPTRAAGIKERRLSGDATAPSDESTT